MKKMLLSAVLLTTVIISPAVHAAAAKGAGPEAITMKALSVPFPHWTHQVSNGSECFHCHNVDGGKIKGWGKEAAHELCIPCHDLNDKGPVQCKQCHK